MFEKQNQFNQNRLRQTLIGRSSLKKNCNWDTRDSFTFSNNHEMNKYKIKQERYMNKLRFMEEKELNMEKTSKQQNESTHAKNRDEISPRFHIIKKDLDAGSRYQTMVLD